MKVSLSASGSFDKTESFLRKLQKLDISRALDQAGREGVAALAAATPRESGLAASSWSYKIQTTSRQVRITWFNRDVEDGFPVAIMLQYGYATGTGGYVQGRDYINPAMKPVFDSIADRVWREVTSA